MHDLTAFTLSDMTACSSALRTASAGVGTMQEGAEKIVRYLYEHLIDRQTGQQVCALVRFYKTHAYGELEPALRQFASARLAGQPPSPTMKCLTLLATAGDKTEWNSRRRSAGHQAIPLPSEAVVAEFPMISQLVSQLGVEVRAVLHPEQTLVMDEHQKTYNVFYVREAVGSPYVPAQDDFVIPFGIRSVLGFGGMLPLGDLFAIIMFAKVSIPRQTADMFKTVALSAKVAVLPFVGGAVFAASPEPSST